ncbi:cupredoxin family copper-binding protein [Candidatus Woesearchaeota archaeon]|nr:cupredoxin family copper-binding protein [Candidatus Woesearchaeota archaeon]
MVFFLVSCGEKAAETEVVATQPVLGEEGAGVEETVVVNVGDSDVSVSVGNDEEKDSEEQSDTEETAEAEIVAVAMRNYKFDDQEIRIKEGTTVVWTNYDSAPHTVDGEGLNSRTISQGESWTYTFTKKGLYDYYCSYHPSMTGNVVVE